MSDSESIAVRWFIPLELSIVRGAAILSSSFLAFVMAVDYLRQDVESLWLHGLGIICLLVMIWAVSNHSVEGRLRRRDISLLVSGVGMSVGVLGLALRSPEYLLVDIWAVMLLIFPSALCLYSASSPVVSRWAKQKLSQDEAESGLVRNKRLLPRWKSALKHAVLAHILIVVIVPVLWIIDVATSSGNSLFGGEMFAAPTGEHFANILGGDDFWIWARNSIIVSIGTTLLGLCLAIPAGYAFSRFRFKGRGAMMFAFLLVQMFPGIIILVPYFMVMKSLGLLNSALGLILAYSVTALPLCVWMLKGFFDTVPKELEEAALLDGCSQFGVFYRIILPLSLPAIAVTALFSFLAAWNEFLLALTFNTSDEMFTLPVGLASYISETNSAWGDFAAMSLLVAIPVVLLFIVFQKFLIEGLTAGSVKG